mmetsp:Transcript_110445/g.152706  ORF Transcript_110445/g.152706 Transcript_110445/m.152706 type:complete len:124 (-) Transcript_110445:247-618(-)
MLLFYHGTFDLLYLLLIIPAHIYKLMIFESDVFEIIILVIYVFWVGTEFSRLRFAYRGNINETFPELIAFLIFTIFFTLPFSLTPIFQPVVFPHEKATFGINVCFIVFELVFGVSVMCKFMKT